MVFPHLRLVLVAGIISFCSNWQFAFQITYVNTSVKTFYDLVNHGYQAVHDCGNCSMPDGAWGSAWSTIVSAFYPGSILGFLLTPTLTNHLGVKQTQILLCVFAIIGCSVHFLADLAVDYGELAVSSVLCLGRFLIGVQAGSSLCLLPLYVIEISPIQHRAFLSTFQQVAQATGTLLGLLIGSEEFIPLGANRFYWLQLFAGAPTVLFLVTLMLTPKTPHQLLKNKADHVTIMESIQFYHCQATPIETVRSECALVEVSLNQQKTEKGDTPERPPITWASWKGFIIGSLAAVSYAFTADDLVDTFSAQILTKSSQTEVTSAAGATVTNESSDIISVVMGFILLVASLFGTVLVERFGRRKLIIIGLMGTALSNVVVIAFPNNPILVTAGFSLTKAFIGLGAGAPAWFLTSELVEPNHATLFQSLSTGMLLTGTMLVTFFFLQLDFIIGSFSVLVLASGPAFTLALILYFFLPETKDKSNAEVQNTLAKYTFSGLRHKNKKKVAPANPIYGAL